MTRGGIQYASKARAIVIGAGLMGRHHAAAIRNVGSDLVAVVDSDVDRARSLARRFPGALASDDLEHVLGQTQPTIAHICAPPGSHLAIARQLAAAKVHSLIEKPLGASAVETRTILGKFDEAGALACPVHQYAFQRSIESAIAARAWFGKLRRIAFDIRSAGGVGDKRHLDSIAAEIVPHPLAIIQRLLPSVDVGQISWKLLRSAPGEWLASASSEGVQLVIAISMGGRPTRFATYLLGTQGELELDNFHDFAVGMTGRVSRSAKLSQPFGRHSKSLAAATLNLAGRMVRRELAYPGLRTLTRRFHQAALSAGSIPSPISVYETIAVAVARDALMAQCRDQARG